MRKTAFQKVVDSHLAKDFTGRQDGAQIDWVWKTGDYNSGTPYLMRTVRGCDKVFDPNKIAQTMIDHVNPPKDTASAIRCKIVREWSQKHGIEFLMSEEMAYVTPSFRKKGWIYPGQIKTMGDSHVCTHGASAHSRQESARPNLKTQIITGLFDLPVSKGHS